VNDLAKVKLLENTEKLDNVEVKIIEVAKSDENREFFIPETDASGFQYLENFKNQAIEKLALNSI
jgi:hypothetical protein